MAGVTLSFEETSFSLEEGGSVTVCITASGIIPEGHSIDFSVATSDGTAQFGSGEPPRYLWCILSTFDFKSLILFARLSVGEFHEDPGGY